jgi:hypothetical protein
LHGTKVGLSCPRVERFPSPASRRSFQEQGRRNVFVEAAGSDTEVGSAIKYPWADCASRMLGGCGLESLATGCQEERTYSGSCRPKFTITNVMRKESLHELAALKMFEAELRFPVEPTSLSLSLSHSLSLSLLSLSLVLSSIVRPPQSTFILLACRCGAVRLGRWGSVQAGG